MSLTYTTYLETIANLLAVSISNASFVQIFPSAIDYANNRIYREADFTNMQATDTGTLLANTRDFTLPSNLGKFSVIDQINVFTPVGTSTTRNPVTPASLELVNALWPSTTAASSATVPNLYAIKSQETDGDIVVTFGPPPGDSFNVEVIGDIIPAPIAPDNPTTFLSTFLPDLMIAATMVYMSGYQKNFGSQADDPKMAVSWDSQYKTLMQSAQLVDARRMFNSQGWTSKQPAPLAASAR